MIMTFIRKLLGAVVVFIDSLTRPKPIVRTPQEQQKVDQITKNMTLYQFHGCPFCVKVRREIHRLNLNIALQDATQKDVEDTLIKGGGKRKVPCLKISNGNTTQWMYESKDIIAYLQKI